MYCTCKLHLQRCFSRTGTRHWTTGAILCKKKKRHKIKTHSTPSGDGSIVQEAHVHWKQHSNRKGGLLYHALFSSRCMHCWAWPQRAYYLFNVVGPLYAATKHTPNPSCFYGAHVSGYAKLYVQLNFSAQFSPGLNDKRTTESLHHSYRATCYCFVAASESASVILACYIVHANAVPKQALDDKRQEQYRQHR